MFDERNNEQRTSKCGSHTDLRQPLRSHCVPRVSFYDARPSMKAKVIVMPKQSILDPQGVAVRAAVQHHGMPGVKSARVGKMIELEIDGAFSEDQIHEICRDLLSNPVIEDYSFVVEN
jgi:phosphoribosylformylglycinamidine synthase subunit PurS